MNLAAPVFLPGAERAAEKPGFGTWIVTVYDNDVNTFDEVIGVLQAATRCSREEAQIEAWEIDALGRSVVHVGNEAACRAAAEVIATIGIRVESTEE